MSLCYKYRGQNYYLLTEYQKAIDDYTKSIELSPDYASYYYHRGEAHLKLGKYEEAIIDCTKAIALEKNNFKNIISYKIRSHAYYALKQYQAAISDYAEVINFSNSIITWTKELPKHYKKKGGIYNKLEQYIETLNDMKKA
ncbi:Tetratricopeptide repeat protein [Rickettsiales bacterium Ac37b]|nr:Tetratricopeptide repeat protein [Rickettsiales bacterium Ac37b]